LQPTDTFPEVLKHQKCVYGRAPAAEAAYVVLFL